MGPAIGLLTVRTPEEYESSACTTATCTIAAANTAPTAVLRPCAVSVPPPQDQQPMRLNYNIECPVCRDKLCLRAQRLYAALDSITETVETDRLTLTVAALRAACHIVGRPLPS